MSGGSEIMSVEVRDRFGDYGLVGAIVYRKDTVNLRIEMFCLSCRVLGRGVEHRIMAEIGRIARAASLRSIRLDCQESSSNGPFLRFVKGLGGLIEQPTERVVSVLLSTDDAVELTFTPGESAFNEEKGRNRPKGGDAPAQSCKRPIVEALSRLPHTLVRMELLQALAEPPMSARREVKTIVDFATPQNELEEAIAQTWTSVLGFDRIGRDKNFFEVGGNSLRLVRLNAKLIENLCRNIEISELFQFPTIRSFAAYLHNETSGQMAAKSYQQGLRARAGMQQLKMQMASGRRQ
jgi:acyl carrier protein